MSSKPWEKPIKITKTLKFGLEDLMRMVDVDYKFTLRDVINSVVNSEIPLPFLKEMLHCGCLEEYQVEMKSKRFKSDANIEYLEVYWLGDRDELADGSSWSFHGVGPEGFVSDSENLSLEELDKLREEGYRQNWAIELSPMYELANYPVKISKEMTIADWSKDGIDNKKIDFKPSITLIELLYAIFWEISFFGNPTKRTKEKEALDKSSKEIDEAIKNGTIDNITMSLEELEAKWVEEK